MKAVDGFTMQGEVQDVMLRRWQVYAKKHRCWRRTTASKVLASILAVSGIVDYFPDPRGCWMQVFVPIEYEYLRLGVEHHWRAIRKLVEQEGRAFRFVFPE